MALAPVSSGVSSTVRPADRGTLALLQAIGRSPDARDPALLEQTAARLVSELFFKPLLSELRGATGGAPFVGGGQAEAVFGTRLDEQLADAAALSGCNGLVRQMVRYLSGPGPTKRTATAMSQPEQTVFA